MFDAARKTTLIKLYIYTHASVYAPQTQCKKKIYGSDEYDQQDSSYDRIGSPEFPANNLQMPQTTSSSSLPALGLHTPIVCGQEKRNENKSETTQWRVNTYNDGASCSGIRTARTLTFECDTTNVHNDDTECASCCGVYQNSKFLSSENKRRINDQRPSELDRSTTAARRPHGGQQDGGPNQGIVEIKSDKKYKAQANLPFFQGKDLINENNDQLNTGRTNGRDNLQNASIRWEWGRQ